MKNDSPESGSLAGDATALKRRLGIESKTSNGEVRPTVDDVVEDLARVGIPARAVNKDVVGVEDPDVDPSTVDDLLPRGWEVRSDDRPATVVREGGRA